MGLEAHVAVRVDERLTPRLAIVTSDDDLNRVVRPADHTFNRALVDRGMTVALAALAATGVLAGDRIGRPGATLEGPVLHQLVAGEDGNLDALAFRGNLRGCHTPSIGGINHLVK